MRRLLPRAMLTVGALLVAASVLAAGNYAFAPPQNWAKQRGGSTTIWVDKGGSQTVTLFPTDFAGDLNAFVNRNLARNRAGHPTLHVWTNRTYALCGGHVGRYLIWTTSANVWEQVLAIWGYDAYVVTYKRPADAPPNSAARASLLSICGVGSVPMAPGGVPVAPQPAVPAAQTQQQQAGALPDNGMQPAPAPTGTISHPYMPVTPP